MGVRDMCVYPFFFRGLIGECELIESFRLCDDFANIEIGEVVNCVEFSPFAPLGFEKSGREKKIKITGFLGDEYRFEVLNERS